MSRYLTPSKIGLLALVSLYTESVVPFASTVPILSFLSSHILAKWPALEPLEHQNSSTALTIEDFQRATSQHPSGIPGRTVWDLLLKKIWKLNSLDSLHLFFDNLSFLLANHGEHVTRGNDDSVLRRFQLSRVSPLGAFVRRAQIEFTRLQFHDGAALWTAFVKFRASSFSQWKKRNASAGPFAFDENLIESSSTPDSGLAVLIYGDETAASSLKQSLSSADVERLLEHQVDQMQRKWSSSLNIEKLLTLTDI